MSVPVLPLKTRHFFCLFCSCSTFGLSGVCVYTGSLKFQATDCCSAGPTYFLAAACSVPVLSEHASCILRGSFPVSPPLHINIVCWKGIRGQSHVETWEYLLFKGLVLYAVLEKGKQRCVFLVEPDARLTQCH